MFAPATTQIPAAWLYKRFINKDVMTPKPPRACPNCPKDESANSRLDWLDQLRTVSVYTISTLPAPVRNPPSLPSGLQHRKASPQAREPPNAQNRCVTSWAMNFIPLQMQSRTQVGGVKRCHEQHMGSSTQTTGQKHQFSPAQIAERAFPTLVPYLLAFHTRNPKLGFLGNMH